MIANVICYVTNRHNASVIDRQLSYFQRTNPVLQPTPLVQLKQSIGVARGQSGHAPKIATMFVVLRLKRPVLQTKHCCSLKIKIFGPSQNFGWLRYWIRYKPHKYICTGLSAAGPALVVGGNVASKLHGRAAARSLCAVATKIVIQRTRLFFRTALLKIGGNIGWGAPPSLDVGPPICNTLHLTHRIYDFM